jgi:methylphosphotriester-DNA--protein-cysteine methyltransferase
MKYFKNRKLIIGITLLIMLVLSQAALASTYIANSHSGVFHYADCRYVGKMSDSHKVYYESRDDAINNGYRPCKICRS